MEIHEVEGFSSRPKVKNPLTGEAHRLRHVELHLALDELIADWMAHELKNSFRSGKSFLGRPVQDLMTWAYEQTKRPTEPV